MKNCICLKPETRRVQKCFNICNTSFARPSTGNSLPSPHLLHNPCTPAQCIASSTRHATNRNLGRERKKVASTGYIYTRSLIWGSFTHTKTSDKKTTMYLLLLLKHSSKKTGKLSQAGKSAVSANQPKSGWPKSSVEYTFKGQRIG